MHRHMEGGILAAPAAEWRLRKRVHLKHAAIMLKVPYSRSVTFFVQLNMPALLGLLAIVLYTVCQLRSRVCLN